MMPAYNFQKQFIPLILNKEKPHTIRHKRKRPTKVGDMLMLYTGMRTKYCKLIAISECSKVEAINIYPGKKVLLNDAWMTNEEITELARRDGFADVDSFFRFFEDHYALPTSDFEMIWWNTDLLMPRIGNGGETRLTLGGVR